MESLTKLVDTLLNPGAGYEHSDLKFFKFGDGNVTYSDFCEGIMTCLDDEVGEEIIPSVKGLPKVSVEETLS